VQRTSLTVRAAYLEVLSDLLGSSAVAGSAIVTLATGVRNADTVAAFAIVALILPRGWRLLREAIDVLLEATPRGVDLDALRTHIIGCNGVLDVHDLHVWTITSGLNVVSAHVVLERHADPALVLDSLGGCLAGDFDIEHSTFQLESEDRQPIERVSHR
jgi:cobalt-zinc-cadmium efflux system protein